MNQVGAAKSIGNSGWSVGGSTGSIDSRQETDLTFQLIIDDRTPRLIELESIYDNLGVPKVKGSR